MVQQWNPGAIFHDLTLIDSSDDDAPFTVPGSAASPARPSRRLVLVPGSVDATPQSIKDGEWDRGSVETPNIQATVHVPPESVAEPGNAEMVSGPVPHVPPADLLDCLEQDLSGEGTIPRASRRLVLVGGGQPCRRTPMSTDSDTESVDSGHSLNSAEGWSEVSGQDDDIELPVVAGIPPVRPSIRSQRVGFEQTDDWNLQEVFRTRASVMRTVPRFLWASFRAALKVALEEIVGRSTEQTNSSSRTRLEIVLGIAAYVVAQASKGWFDQQGEVDAEVRQVCLGSMD